MCGRFTVTNPGRIPEQFGLPIPPELCERYNVAPSDPVPILPNRKQAGIELARWGLVPSFGDQKQAAKMINARAESIDARPSYRTAFARRRCLVLADGYFEWRKEGRRRLPHYIRLESGEPFGFAGIWEAFRQSDDDEWRITCAIVTVPANDLLRPIHERMPLTIAPEARTRWLHPEPIEREVVDDLLVTPPSTGWVAYPVSTRVNSVSNDDPGCIEPALPELRLFE